MGSGSPASLSQTDGQGPDGQDAPRRLANGDRAKSPGGGDARSCPCRLAVREQQCVAGGAGQTMPQPAAQSGLSPPPRAGGLGCERREGATAAEGAAGNRGPRSGAGTASQRRDEGGTRRVRQAPLRPPPPRGPARARGPQARVAPGGTPQATGAGAVTERRMRSWARASAPAPWGARQPRCGRGALRRQGADAGRGRPGAGLPNPNPRRRLRCRRRLLVVPPGRPRAPRVVGVASAEPPGHVTMGLVARAQNT